MPDSGTAFGDVNEGGTESGGGSGPRAIGASLVVVYRDSAMPFKAIVIYDGGFKKTAFATMNQTIAGFYQASDESDGTAKMTHIVGDGRQGVSERVFLDGQLIATNPFVGAEGPKWDNPTFPLTSIPPPLDPGGASVAVKVAPNGLLSDCLCYSGIVLSTEVQDSDGDGLLDVWETNPSLVDPNGQPLPNLKAMGASKDFKDLFIEIGYMETLDPTTYGGVPKPAHSHLPAPAALKLVGDAFANAPLHQGAFRRRKRLSAGQRSRTVHHPWRRRSRWRGHRRNGHGVPPGDDGPAVGVPVLGLSGHGGLEDPASGS